jgi:hypothetical protein
MRANSVILSFARGAPFMTMLARVKISPIVAARVQHGRSVGID